MRRFTMTFWVVAGAFLGLCLTTTSCNGSAGKKAATEVIKAFEKESGSLERNAGRFERAAVSAEESSGKLSKEAEEEYNTYSKYRKAKRSADRAQEFFEEDEQQATPQAVTITCPYCQGNGMVYATDAYGNVVFDYYGNPQVTFCPKCQGNGQVVVYQ